ncbi:CLUMA_CG006286, isoform A [Clunio marinus]|uniref:CLUMA_CG006286, isoform A n=1 Tax=Clunio marinus TaxID=568069 RepID=A0A1J1HXJ5_9DIPT|nr:CLUMA_CG006286, isoform A [Clunio marinus]
MFIEITGFTLSISERPLLYQRNHFRPESLSEPFELTHYNYSKQADQFNYVPRIKLTISPESSHHFGPSSVIMKEKNDQLILDSHLNMEKMSNAKQICRWENCFRIFENLEKLANHIGTTHSSIGLNNLYYCKWEGCQRSERGFNARYKMLVHCRTHTKEKPHNCTFPECNKSFSRAENLKIHIRSHTLEKPYRCSYPGCFKAYSNSSDRFKHSRTHFNTKPYLCKIPGCLKRYTDPSSLRKHVKNFNHDNLGQKIKILTSNKKSMDLKFISSSNQIVNNFCDSLNIKNINSVSTCTSDNCASNFYRMQTLVLDEPLDLSLKHNK